MNKQFNNNLGSVNQDMWKQVKRAPLLKMDNLPALSERIDGVNCINIWLHGETELGVYLDKATYTPIVHNKLGNFNTIDGIWNYLLSKSHDDRFRQLTGYKLVRLARELPLGFCVNFRAAILDSTYQKIRAYPDLLDMVIKSDLPFDCWFVDKQTKVKQRPIRYVFWYIPGFEEIRKALKENREPNFIPWMRDPSVGIYDDILAKITVKAKTSNQDDPDDDPSGGALAMSNESINEDTIENIDNAQNLNNELCAELLVA